MAGQFLVKDRSHGRQKTWRRTKVERPGAFRYRHFFECEIRLAGRAPGLIFFKKETGRAADSGAAFGEILVKFFFGRGGRWSIIRTAEKLNRKGAEARRLF